MTRQHTRLVLWLLAIAVAAGFAWLGRWQLDRMHQKEALLRQASQVRQHPLTLDAALAQAPRLAWASGMVELLPQQVLLDNQMREGRAGVRIYQPARTGNGAWLLVDLGWWPLPPDRQLPVLAPLAGREPVRGLLAPPPSAGIALGPALTRTADGGAAGSTVSSTLGSAGGKSTRIVVAYSGAGTISTLGSAVITGSSASFSSARTARAVA